MPERGVVDCGLYVSGVRDPLPRTFVEALAHARSRPHAFVWVDLQDPGADEILDLAQAFDLHELAVEDVMHGERRPGVEIYEAMVLCSMQIARYVPHGELTEFSDVVETGTVWLFVAQHYVITLRRGGGRVMTLPGVQHRLEGEPAVLTAGPWAVAYALFDWAVESYIDCATEVGRDVEALEESVFDGVGRRSSTQRIYRFKREVVELRRAVVPLQRPVESIVAGHVSMVPPDARNEFRILSDHLSRVVDQVISFDDLVGSMLQAHLAQIDVDQNSDMRKIAAWAAIAAVWGLVAGLYQMSEDIPALHGKNGVVTLTATLVVSLAVSGFLYRSFRRQGWL